MAEEDLLPPGIEPEPGSVQVPKPKAASVDPLPPATSETVSKADSKDTTPSIPPPEAPPSIPAPPPGIRIPPPSVAGGPPNVPPPAPGPPVHQFFPPPPPSLAMGARMRFPPPPPMSLPPMRPGFNMPAGRPPPFGGHGGPHGPRFRPAPRPSNVFASAPQIIKSDTKIVSETMIQAKPQIRSLSADVTRLVPSILKQKRDDLDKPKRHGTRFKLFDEVTIKDLYFCTMKLTARVSFYF